MNIEQTFLRNITIYTDSELEKKSKLKHIHNFEYFVGNDERHILRKVL